jgi:predicted secreted hydrolase
MTLLIAAFSAASAAESRRAEPGWHYEFPRDHSIHEEFKTEWWYFTGNLSDEAGRRFGYQLTFFRQGILHPAEREPAMSRFVVGDLKFSHFTVTDVAGRQFRFQQKTSRGAFGEAGYNDGERIAWNKSWELRLDRDGVFHLVADMPEAAIKLQLRSSKPPVIHGGDGLSRKAEGEGHASHYYSLTRIATAGEVRIGDRAFQVTGESWFDHEWATNQLAPQQIGWDWLSAQFDDGTELMLYQIRLENGSADRASSGTLVARDGAAKHLTSAEFRMTPAQHWKSGSSGARYPVGWRIEVPGERLELTVRPVLENQELALMPLTYWEGAVEISGTRDGKPVKGHGYLELTGYAGPLRELNR